VPVGFFAFDLLYSNGEVLLDLPLRERRARLASLLAETTESMIQLSPVRTCNTAEELQRGFTQALARGNEGVMVKALDSPYTPGRRGQNWRKLKAPLATLDVVVVAVEHGHGKRREVLSDYTFAVQTPQGLATIGKAYSGLTDAEIAQLTEFFKAHTVEDSGWRRRVEPLVVIEVAFNNIQQSNRHESGYALRFPRIVRLRPDKPISEIDTLDRVKELYERQFPAVSES
jgi:DNA ligase 1